MADVPEEQTQDLLMREIDAPRVRTIGVRVLTLELAQAFAAELTSDLSHSVESAAIACGIKPSTVRMALKRANDDTCNNLDDEEICDVLAAAKAKHIKDIRAAGYICAGRENRAGTSWMQWQLETQAPLEHPRKQQMDVALAGKDGGPIETSNTLRYVVSVPKPEPEEQEA